MPATFRTAVLPRMYYLKCCFCPKAFKFQIKLDMLLALHVFLARKTSPFMNWKESNKTFCFISFHITKINLIFIFFSYYLYFP